MLKPVKVAFGKFIERYYASLVPTTEAILSFKSRGIPYSIVWAPARMVDSAEELLSKWFSSPIGGPLPKLPVILVAMAKDYIPTGRDFSRQIADETTVLFPEDDTNQPFGLRAVVGTIRAQIAIFAHDESTARSLAAQFLLFLDKTGNRVFWATYTHEGHTANWPVEVETPEVSAIAGQVEAKNITILTIDLSLMATIPFYSSADPLISEVDFFPL